LISDSKLMYIPDSWVKENINIKESVVTVENTLRDCGNGKILLSRPSSMSLETPLEDAATFKVKGAVLLNRGVAGFRLIGKEASVEGKRQKLSTYCYLTDMTSGIPFAVIDEDTQYVTRAGAMTAVGLKLLANLSDKKKLVIVGTGSIAYAAAQACIACLDLRELVIVARRAVSGEAFIKKIRPYTANNDIAVSLSYNIQESISDADMVITATSANTSLLYPKWLPEGVTICVVGGTQELAPDFLLQGGKIIVDDFDWCKHAGSIGAWIDQGIYTETTIQDKIYGSVGDVASGKLPGREKVSERVTIIMQGMASLDIAMGLMLFEKAKQSDDPRLQNIKLF